MDGIWIPWLADAARLTGWPVVEVAGWRGRGTGGADGGMHAAEGVVLHHTAGPRAGEMPSLAVIRDGRAGLSGPLSHYGLGRSGTVYVVAAGACNHAGTSTWAGISGLNSRFVGVEAEDDGDGTWTGAQLDCYPRLVAAALHYMRRDASRAAAHREVALPAGRKPDPAGIDMPAFRRRVAQLLTDPTRLIPRDQQEDALSQAEVDQIKRHIDARAAEIEAHVSKQNGFARSQVLTELGSADPESAPHSGVPVGAASKLDQLLAVVSGEGPPRLSAADHDAIAYRLLALLAEHPLVPKGSPS